MDVLVCLRHLTPAVSRANSQSEVRAEAVGVGSSALLNEALRAAYTLKTSLFEALITLGG